jgi:hypothetical protein
MEKKYLDTEIYYIENVLSSEDLSIVQAFAQEEDGWRGSVQDGSALELGSSSNSLKSMSDEVYDIFNKMFDDVITKSEPNLNIFPVSEIQRFRSGLLDHKSKEWSMNPHADNHQEYAITANIEKGLVFYINDDFEGGEIEYINKGIRYKPVANCMIVHSSYNEYTHGVRLVTKGDRYIMTNFYRS